MFFVSDSGSNYVSAKSQNADIVDWVTCFGHNLHLAVNDAIKPNTIVAFYNRSSEAYANLFKNQEKLNGPGTALRLINAVDTRWNSEYQKEVRLLKIKNALSISMNEGSCCVTIYCERKTDAKISHSRIRTAGTRLASLQISKPYAEK